MTDVETPHQIPLDPVAAYLLRERDWQRNEALMMAAQLRDAGAALARITAEKDLISRKAEELWSENEALKAEAEPPPLNEPAA